MQLDHVNSCTERLHTFAIILRMISDDDTGHADLVRMIPDLGFEVNAVQSRPD